MNQAVHDFEKAMTRHLKNFQDPKRVRGPRPVAIVSDVIGLRVELAVRRSKRGVANDIFEHIVTSTYDRDLAVMEATRAARDAGFPHVAFVIDIQAVKRDV